MFVYKAVFLIPRTQFGDPDQSDELGCGHGGPGSERIPGNTNLAPQSPYTLYFNSNSISVDETNIGYIKTSYRTLVVNSISMEMFRC